MGSLAEAYPSTRPAATAICARIPNRLATCAVVLAADLAAVIVAGAAGVVLWRLVNQTIAVELHLRLWPALAVFPIAFASRGLYPGVSLSPVEELRRSVLAASVVYLVASASLFLYKEGDLYSRGIFLVCWALTVTLVPAFRAILRALCGSRGWWGVGVLVLGAGEAGRMVVQRLRAEPGCGLKPVAYLDDSAEQGAVRDGLPVVGPLWQAAGIGRQWRVTHALVALPNLSREELLELVDRAGSAFSHLIVIPDLFGMASLWVSAVDFGGVLGLEVRQNLLSPLNRALKRALDLILAVTAGLVALPVVAAAIVWIKRASPGPAFFRQERGGAGGMPVRVWKLRTMHPDGEEMLRRHLEQDSAAREEWRRFFKLRHDPRLIPGIGPLLRCTSLDELPQLWNVLKGEMSLVGPRPFPAYHLDQFDQKFRALRARVLPGLTGLWQVSARSDGDLEVQRALDTYYIRNWSLWLDLYILFRTIRAVLLRKGAC